MSDSQNEYPHVILKVYNKIFHLKYSYGYKINIVKHEIKITIGIWNDERLFNANQILKKLWQSEINLFLKLSRPNVITFLRCQTQVT